MVPSRLVLVLAVALAACRGRSEVVVFHASSLSRALSDLAEAFQREDPRALVRLEPSGSLVAARKVSELGMRADLVLSADKALLDRVLVPAHAAWSLAFATNELVLAHKDHSRFTDEVTSQNWPEVLQRPGVRLGRPDPDLAPLGYQTLFAWLLAERSGLYGEAGRDLAARLLERCAREHVTQDETELAALLEARAVDYAFLFRSTAEDHRLKRVELSPAINLGHLDRAAEYSAVEVEVRMKLAGDRTRLRGAPVVYGLAIPTNAPNPAAAKRFAAYLLSGKGLLVLKRAGLAPLTPARGGPVAALPPELRPFAESAP